MEVGFGKSRATIVKASVPLERFRAVCCCPSLLEDGRGYVIGAPSLGIVSTRSVGQNDSCLQ